jgi:glucose 1-dehydrogenase
VSNDFTLMPEPARLLGGRKALVTGADSGIGQGIAFELAAHGAAVAVNCLDDPTVADDMVARIGRGGGQALAVQMDVSSEVDVTRALATARKGFGGLDLLVNNAGIEARSRRRASRCGAAAPLTQNRGRRSGRRLGCL